MKPAESPVESSGSLALLAFKIGPNQFDINRNLAYISIKDQILRARTLVHATVAAGIFEVLPGTTSVESDDVVDVHMLVVGAGVGGVSAALAAVECGLTVILIDKGRTCFSLLRRGATRLISTTVYDWPSLHYDVHQFPAIETLQACSNPNAAILRFPAHAANAAELADHLQNEFANLAKKYAELLSIEYNTFIKSISDIRYTSGRRVSIDIPRQVRLPDGSAKNKFFSRVVVFATGFGQEKINQNSTSENDEFWGYATLEDDLARTIDAPASKPAIVSVIGAGDGGLQEVLRLMLKPEFHDLAATTGLLATKLSRHKDSWQRMLRQIAAAEDNAARAFMWGYAPKLVFGGLDTVYDSVINELTAASRSDAINQWFEEVTRPQNLCIELYDPHAVSGRVYALNRFLVKLIQRLSSSRQNGVRLLRMVGDGPAENVGIARIDRRGLLPLLTEGIQQDELLRRMAFKGLQNHYGAIA